MGFADAFCKTNPVEVDLILLAGQSNAVGFDTHGQALKEEPVDRQILFWWRCGDPPADKYDSTSNSQWTFLKAQPKGKPSKDNVIGRQYGNFRSDLGGFGPEIGLGRYLQKNKPLKKIAIVKVAYNGTSITEWGRSKNEKITCYQALLNETKIAILKAKKDGINLHTRALVWVQGEGDAKEKVLADNYENNLKNMIEALQQDLKAPKMKILLSFNVKIKGGEIHLW